VASFSPGTGQAFSALPAQNATGNWVKVVQRVPVRLHLTGLDPAFFLQAGLSADVTVDTHSQAEALASSGGTADGTVSR
jgi:membrane fusion protein (multidrug efflux system)